MINILGLGHPRTGTGYTSALCRLWGLSIGHERLENDGRIGNMCKLRVAGMEDATL